MDNLRFILIVSIGFIIYQLSLYWDMDYGPKQNSLEQVQPVTEPSDSIADSTADLPEINRKHAIKITPAEGPVNETSTPTQLPDTNKKKLLVATDVLSLEIDSTGTIVLLDLLHYPLKKEQPDIPLKLFEQTKDHWFIAQSGLIAPKGMASNHQSTYQFDRDSYQLKEGSDSLHVPLYWSNGRGIEITKTFIFKRGKYLIGLEQTILNNSGEAWTGTQYLQLQRSEASTDDESSFIRTYTGGVIYDQKYEKIEFDKMLDKNLDREVIGGWIAMIQHYFAAAWIPTNNEKNRFYTISLPNQNRFVIGYSSAQAVEIGTGDSYTFNSGLYVGPKIQNVMEKTAKGLELTVDYGILTFIGKPIFWLLEKFHSLVGNWGFAIAMVTLVIKAIFFPLSAASYRSMAKMRRLQPKLQAIKERYEDDKPRFNQEMMALYRAEKVNPLGGCFPILVQIPVFISLYWVLMETVELRQAPFLLWVNDLSIQDPYYVLPLLMGFTMWIQQRLNPTPVDPIQEKVMKLFPYIFTIFFLWFPAGLVLYWVVNNTLSIIQQWYITRKIEQGQE
ncbi:membrane protein insertase YidC [bacterium]|nr:membrane protein insertase YidC [bacterium]